MRDYRKIIEQEFKARKLLNPSYSLRSYARDLDMSPSQISEVLNRKKGLSTEKAEMLADSLRLNTREKNQFISLVQLEHSKSKKLKREAEKYLASNQRNKKLNPAVFHLISDWYYFALLASMQLDTFDGSAAWLAKHLNLKQEKVLEALSTLIELKLVKKETSLYQPQESNLETETDFHSMALRISHKQTLHQALQAITQVDVHKRDITSTTMAIDIKKLPAAKRRIEKFRKEICEFLESGEKNAVYNINIQLHPLSHQEKIQ